MQLKCIESRVAFNLVQVHQQDGLIIGLIIPSKILYSVGRFAGIPIIPIA